MSLVNDLLGHSPQELRRDARTDRRRRVVEIDYAASSDGRVATPALMSADTSSGV